MKRAKLSVKAILIFNQTAGAKKKKKSTPQQRKHVQILLYVFFPLVFCRKPVNFLFQCNHSRTNSPRQPSWKLSLRQSPLTDWRYKRIVLWHPVSRDFKNTGTKKVKTKKPSAAKPVKRIVNLFYSDKWHGNNSQYFFQTNQLRLECKLVLCLICSLFN